MLVYSMRQESIYFTIFSLFSLACVLISLSRFRLFGMEEPGYQVIGTGNYSNAIDLLDTFHLAAETANLIQYFGCFHTNGRFLGTDATENWPVNEFYDFSKGYFLRGSAWTYRPKHETRKLTYFPNESAPLFCIFDELLESESFVATSRGSGTLVFDGEKGTWLISQYHLSFPILNDLAKEMTRIISVFEASDKAANAAAQQLIEEWEKEEATADKASSKGGNCCNKSKGKGKKK